MERRTREPGKLTYRLAIAVLLVLGVLSLPSIGWLLIAVALVLALYGGFRSKRAVTAPLCAGLLALIGAFVLFAPAFCVGGAATCGPGVAGCVDASFVRCTSLVQIPLGAENWILFVVLGPMLAVAAVVLVRKRSVAS